MLGINKYCLNSGMYMSHIANQVIIHIVITNRCIDKILLSYDFTIQILVNSIIQL